MHAMHVRGVVELLDRISFITGHAVRAAPPSFYLRLSGVQYGVKYMQCVALWSSAIYTHHFRM